MDGAVDWEPVGLHITYLGAEGTSTMQRRKPWANSDDPDPMLPKRRMLGPVGNGAILLGQYSPDAHLFVGEGNETVLSAIGLAGGDDGRAQVAGGGSAENIVGLATLSLDNLQGAPKKWNGGIWPLHQIEPDPERGPFVIPGHRGAVTGLIDSDMSALRGMRDQRTGAFQGEKLVERKHGPIVQRAITGAERASICADLVVKGWRQAGAHPVTALRAPAGMDFNDAAVAARETV
jgi:DNA primase